MNAELVALLDEALAKGWSADQVALKMRNAQVASWVKYLDKAREKLPTWSAARCWIDERSYIQSSSEASAAAKFDGLSGKLAVDLTLGLGVDAAAMAARFDRVIGVEADPQKAEAARFNFSRLGLNNIEVVCAKAEDFLAENSLPIDLIYIDPSRVDAQGKKVYSLEQSTPNVLELRPLFQSKTIIKLAPLFDVGEALRIFDAAVEVVSVGGECKEVLVRLGEEPELRCTIIDKNGVRRLHFPTTPAPHVPSSTAQVTYIYVPDVAIAKARVVGHYMAHYAADYSIENNLIFSAEKLEHFIGQEFTVSRMEPYKPKALRKELSGKQFEIHLGPSFPYPIAQLSAQLGIKVGGNQKLFFCTVTGRLCLFFVSLSL